MDKMKTCFSGKVAVVTGGAHGIGKCIKEEFENYGVSVYVIDKAEGDHFVGDLSSKVVIEKFCDDVIKKNISKQIERITRYEILMNKADTCCRSC